MTNLTDKWKKGELTEGFYFVNDGAEVTIDYYLCDYWERHFDSDVQEVLDKVPSYNEWDKLNNVCHELEKETACLTVDNVNLKKWCEEFNALEVAKENTKFKELLKECRSPINYALCLNLSEEEKKEFKNLLAKIKQVLGEE